MEPVDPQPHKSDTRKSVPIFGYQISGFGFEASDRESFPRNPFHPRVRFRNGRNSKSETDFQISCFGFRLPGFGFWDAVFSFRLSFFRSLLWGFELTVTAARFGFSAFGFRIWGLRFRTESSFRGTRSASAARKSSSSAWLCFAWCGDGVQCVYRLTPSGYASPDVGCQVSGFAISDSKFGV